MKTIKTAELTGAALDWAVAKCEGIQWWAAENPCDGLFTDYERAKPYTPSTDWAQGGPILDRELIDLNYDIHWVRDLLDPEDNGDRWYTSKAGQDEQGCYGPTALIAAMRCFVASKLGDEVEVPEELL